MNKDQGYFLIGILIFAAISAAAVSGLLSFTNTNLLSARRAVASEQAFRAAEAGVERYRFLLNSGGGGGSGVEAYDLLDKDGNAAGSVVTTSTAYPGGVSVRSRGEAGGAVRTIETDFIQGEGVSFYYGVQSGNGGFTLGNGAEVIGNVYSNADIEGGNGSSITGDAIAVGSISGVDVGGESASGADEEPLPISEVLINEWKAEAPQKIVGNLTVGSNDSLVLEGTIWVTGNVTIGNGASVSLSPAYGTRGGMIIADGTISLGNNALFDGSGSPESSLLLISTSVSSSAITLGNNTGAVVLYAPNGTIGIGNNADVRVVAAKTVSLGNNVVLEYEQGVISAVFSSGPSGAWSLASWREVAND